MTAINMAGAEGFVKGGFAAESSREPALSWGVFLSCLDVTGLCSSVKSGEKC